ncbi:Vitamin K epoxide reductase family protein [Candidatus Sulfotelmatobacter kueseliae]|uniref:Vitamin K epoxide reductase family protein n=1 Tax=Candidatus Sulfotelmatobacter kueseliae TaxID=2042962 RepID=A0A2U3KMS9_9BACT|nr:Vitamin K epoxide reductase family protein [Candidatus Sulfotelmatobacter kueseliae]
MKYALLILAIFGIIVSSLALREHYRTYGDSPCSINERWDCGVVNHSHYAMLAGIPVAALGIAGYILMGMLAFLRSYRLLLVVILGGLGFSLYLAHIEKDVLGVWCIYCVISLGIISMMTLLNLGTVIAQIIRPPNSQSARH